LSGEGALVQHKAICGSHKAILPLMPPVNTKLEFKNFKNTIRHPIVIYSNFEAMLVKTNEQKGDNTVIINKHVPMSFGFVVKPREDVPLELLERFNIPLAPVVYRGSEGAQDVARHFVNEIVDVGSKIEQLLRTNVAMIMSEADEIKHRECKYCEIYKCLLIQNQKVRDHCHLTGQFRQTLCSS